jgi:hypothetical protein
VIDNGNRNQNTFCCRHWGQKMSRTKPCKITDSRTHSICTRLIAKRRQWFHNHRFVPEGSSQKLPWKRVRSPINPYSKLYFSTCTSHAWFHPLFH